MTVETDDEESPCDYASFKRYMLLKSLHGFDISPDIRIELEKRYNGKYAGVELVNLELGAFLFSGENENILKANEEMFHLSEKACAKLIISRCIQLWDDGKPTHFNFVLAAAFLKESIFHFFQKYKCFRMLYIVDFCLDVLCDRMFWEVFKTKEFYDKLQLFCDEFIEQNMTHSKQGELQKSAAGEYWRNFFKERLRVIDDYFSFTKKEEECFDKCYAVESIAVLEDWPISDETEKAVGDCFDARRYYPSDCMTCGSKCSDYLNYIRLL
ncbi:hypothetical protein TNIN_106651 [Trichonephila inaurata madagascariensis]|uniref:Uncharacterized protein n=1 Tax=Trichonephila inaurata madagascariensis TaxID=2747483 RepID=A0A8X6XBZ8_9ARAC|nr:hypothetical protein TNIN_106651 [Trichonephila inaurata madagascariensis]